MTEKKIKALALKIYDGEECTTAFEEAWVIFPDFNAGGEDTDKAEEYIQNQIIHLVPERLSEATKDKIHEELSEMIYAGLT